MILRTIIALLSLFILLYLSYKIIESPNVKAREPSWFSKAINQPIFKIVMGGIS